MIAILIQNFLVCIIYFYNMKSSLIIRTSLDSFNS